MRGIRDHFVTSEDLGKTLREQRRTFVGHLVYPLIPNKGAIFRPHL